MNSKNAGQLQVEWWPTERPTPYARNARVAPPQAVSKVAASIKEFGWQQPIVVDAEGVIIVGHTRLLAAQQLGIEQVPVLVATDLTPAQVKAYRLADNRTAQETSWDDELLSIEIEELADLDIELSLTGFDDEELARLTAGADCDEETEVIPEPPEEPVSKLGDLYLLGPHRLLCGDSTDPACVQRLMNGERAALMFTDPPYLVDYDGGNHPQSYNTRGEKREPGASTKHWDAYTDPEKASAFFEGFLRAAFDEALLPDAAVYQCFATMRTDIVMAAWRDAGLLPHQILVWKKSRPVLTRCWFMWDWEPILVGWMKGNQPKAKPPNNERAVWEIGTTEGVEDGVAGTHPTIKPVELVRRPIAWHTIPGGLIYEPFSGSGTAIVAAEQTGRRCFALELSPAFVDVAVQRWENLTGEKARLA